VGTGLTFATLVIILLLLSITLIIYWRPLSIGFGKSKEYVVPEMVLI
jgi:hypothetical protein